MRPLRVKLLGQFECSLGNDERIVLSTRKNEVLLAFLALAPGLRQPRDRLINLLWSDRSEEQARNSLRQALSAMKKTLGDSADLILQVDRNSVTLQSGFIEVDALEFEQLASLGDYESLVTAADLYQGEFLEGVSIRDPASQAWLDNERERFKRQYIELLKNLAETQLITHDYDHAIKSAERLVKQDSLHESGWRLLMQAYAGNGERNRALQTFKRCEQVLLDELGVDPESATIELRDQIASGNNKTDQPARTEKSAAPKTPVKQGETDSTHSIAVLPFDNLSGDPQQEYFSDGITESIILNLSLFPDLNVKGRNSSFAFKQQIKSIGEISEALGVDYLVEGSVRKSDERIRITVQLIDANTGDQIWGKRYDAKIDDLFDLEEDLSRTIAVTVTGQIDFSLERIAISKGASDQQAYDLLLAGQFHMNQFNGKDMVKAIDYLDRCLELDPGNVRAHAGLYFCHAMNWAERWIEDFEPAFQRAADHAEKAIELGADIGFAQVAYAEYQIFCHNYDSSSRHLEKALAINPNDTDALTTKAMNLEMQGKFEAAREIAELAWQLDPYHPWADWILAESYFCCGEYEKTLKVIAESNNAPGFIRLYNIAANVRLARLDQARKALNIFLEECRAGMLAMPCTLDEWMSYTIANAPFADASINQEIMDCLVEAGLKETLVSPPLKTATGSEPSIAILPFENLSADPEQEYFADGITVDLIETLSKFRHLRTISRYSTLPYKESKPSIAEIAEHQNVRYILEGNVRKSGNRIRVSAELVDSVSDNIVWSERFDRDLEDLFAVQDELTMSIAVAMKVKLDHGDMARVRSKGTSNVRAWELTMTAVDLEDTYILENILKARRLAEKATQLDPGYPYAWICLGWSHWMQAYIGGSESIEISMDEAEKANNRAFELDPDYAEVWSLSGQINLMRHNTEAALNDSRRAVELEPDSAEFQGLAAFVCIFAGLDDEALGYHQREMRLSPIRANWTYLGEGYFERARGNFDKAAEKYRQGIAVEPDSPLCRYYLIDLLMEQGDEASAQKYADEIRALDKSVNARGIAHSFSADPALRQKFHDHLAQFGLV